MARIEYEKIKARLAAASPVYVDRDAHAGDDGDVTPLFQADIRDPETATFIESAHDDMHDLIKEHDRFISNYRLALEFFDNFMNHHASVLPADVAREAREVQVQMRGLL